MANTFSFLDYMIFIVYGIIIVGVGLWVSRDKEGHQKNADDYFWLQSHCLGGQLELP